MISRRAARCRIRTSEQTGVPSVTRSTCGPRAGITRRRTWRIGARFSIGPAGSMSRSSTPTAKTVNWRGERSRVGRPAASWNRRSCITTSRRRVGDLRCAAVYGGPLGVRVNVIAPGLLDWQTASGPPAVTVAPGVTLIVRVALTAEHGPTPSGSLEVKVNVTVPVKLAAGV